MTAAELGSRVGAADRRYLNDAFVELCRIESPSGRERACAGRVIADLRALGLKVDEYDAGVLAGSDCGDLLARIPAQSGPGAEERSGIGRRSVMLCAHLDTGPLQAPVEPVLIDGHWENANEGILGADNKAAVAVMLALARHLCRERAPVDVELLFTVGQEAAIAGAHGFDASRLRSDFGYVFDHSSPIGEVILDSPSQFRMTAAFHGVAANAGVSPEEGRSAILAAAHAIASMRLGRLEQGTTVNVGTISGGAATDVVPERCSLAAEVRSSNPERAETVVAELVDRVHEAANLPECDCDVDVSLERTFSGYRQPATTPAVRAAEAALRACGHEPVRVSSGATSAANPLLAQGFETVNLANGTERGREPGERVSVAALEGMLDVALSLLDEAGAASVDTAL